MLEREYDNQRSVEQFKEKSSKLANLRYCDRVQLKLQSDDFHKTMDDWAK